MTPLLSGISSSARFAIDTPSLGNNVVILLHKHRHNKTPQYQTRITLQTSFRIQWVPQRLFYLLRITCADNEDSVRETSHESDSGQKSSVWRFFWSYLEVTFQHFPHLK